MKLRNRQHTKFSNVLRIGINDFQDIIIILILVITSYLSCLGIVSILTDWWVSDSSLRVLVLSWVPYFCLEQNYDRIWIRIMKEKQCNYNRRSSAHQPQLQLLKYNGIPYMSAEKTMSSMKSRSYVMMWLQGSPRTFCTTAQGSTALGASSG